MSKRYDHKQLALWILAASFARLKALAADEKTSQPKIIERALEQYQPINEPARKVLEDRLDELAGILADQQTRLKALEASLVMTRQPLEPGTRRLNLSSQKLDKTRLLDESSQKLDIADRNRKVFELHQQQVSGRKIADILGLGETTIRRILKKSAPMETPNK